jgi:site-specific DNA recombinase
MLARMLGAAARHEAEHKAERQQRAGLQKARAGKPHPAGTRGYGYQADGVTVAAEAEIIREAKTRVLAGESAHSVAGDLNDRGVPTVTGTKWSAAVLRQILSSGRISGRREYHGEIMTDQPSWAAIITTAESDQLRAILARRPGTPRGRARSYLFSGIFTCGNCHAGLYGKPHSAGLRYVCVQGPGKPGCGKVAVMAAPAEQIARDKILTALDSPDFVTALITATSASGDNDAAGISAQLRDLDGQREELAKDMAARRITRKEWLAARDELTSQIDSLTASLSRSEHSRALVSFASMTGTVWDRWEQMTDGARRALVKAATAAIPVSPATSRRWNPARIGAPLWRT